MHSTRLLLSASDQKCKGDRFLRALAHSQPSAIATAFRGSVHSTPLHSAREGGTTRMVISLMTVAPRPESLPPRLSLCPSRQRPTALRSSFLFRTTDYIFSVMYLGQKGQEGRHSALGRKQEGSLTPWMRPRPHRICRFGRRGLGRERANSTPINLTSKIRAMPDGIFATSKDAELVFH